MKIQVPGGSFNTKELPKTMQRKLRRKRARSKIMPVAQMAAVALVVDLILRAVL